MKCKAGISKTDTIIVAINTEIEFGISLFLNIEITKAVPIDAAAVLTILFPVSTVARSFSGCSSNFAISSAPRILSLISFASLPRCNDKKAASDPEKKADNKSDTINSMTIVILPSMIYSLNHFRYLIIIL